MEKSYIYQRHQETPKICYGSRKTCEECECYCSIKTPDFYYSIEEPNNFCYVGKNIVKIIKIIKVHNLPSFEGQILTNLKSLFTDPIDSQKLKIHETREIIYEKHIAFSIQDITNKAIVLKNKNKTSIGVFPFII